MVAEIASYCSIRLGNLDYCDCKDEPEGHGYSSKTLSTLTNLDACT